MQTTSSPHSALPFSATSTSHIPGLCAGSTLDGLIQRRKLSQVQGQDKEGRQVSVVSLSKTGSLAVTLLAPPCLFSKDTIPTGQLDPIIFSPVSRLRGR